MGLKIMLLRTALAAPPHRGVGDDGGRRLRIGLGAWDGRLIHLLEQGRCVAVLPHVYVHVHVHVHVYVWVSRAR